jgi:carbon dioxide concentrating mechanism protein CcmN
MPVPLLRMQPISHSHYYTSGDVTIQAGVAIAPGVLLQADPDCRIVVKTGACIGIGAVLHARRGLVEIGEGANIGAEVLLIGPVSVGAHACIGAATTVINSLVEQGQMIPPGSLIGELALSEPGDLKPAEPVYSPTVEIDPAPQSSSSGAAYDTAPAAPAETSSTGINVYGQVYVNKLLVKMFPHRQQAQPPDRPEDDPWELSERHDRT